MGEIIEGWAKLEEFLGISESQIRRYMRVLPMDFDHRARIGRKPRIRVSKRAVKDWWKTVTGRPNETK